MSDRDLLAAELERVRATPRAEGRDLLASEQRKADRLAARLAALDHDRGMEELRALIRAHTAHEADVYGLVPHEGAMEWQR
jgi:hypothetical protein